MVEPEKSAEQLETLLVSVAAIKETLEANEWRRKCIWVLASINRVAGNLQPRYAGREGSFQRILERLDCFVNLVFRSAQDLHTVFICLSLVAGIFDDLEKSDGPSTTDLWEEIRPLIDDLETLDSGDPPEASAATRLMRDLQPELQDAERVAVRDRFNQRSRARIEERFASRRAERAERIANSITSATN